MELHFLLIIFFWCCCLLISVKINNKIYETVFVIVCQRHVQFCNLFCYFNIIIIIITGYNSIYYQYCYYCCCCFFVLKLYVELIMKFYGKKLFVFYDKILDFSRERPNIFDFFSFDTTKSINSRTFQKRFYQVLDLNWVFSKIL